MGMEMACVFLHPCKALLLQLLIVTSAHPQVPSPVHTVGALSSGLSQLPSSEHRVQDAGHMVQSQFGRELRPWAA